MSRTGPPSRRPSRRSRDVAPEERSVVREFGRSVGQEQPNRRIRQRRKPPNDGTEMSLADKVALVTGGSRGIGAAIAQSLAEAGAAVGLCARHLEAAVGVAKALE